MLRHVGAITLVLLLLGSQAIAQASSPAQAAPPGSSAEPTINVDQPFVLEDGTPVKMRTNRTISSADAAVGDQLDFEILEEVRVNGVVVIPKGSIAWATVTEAQKKRRMGRAGKLNLNIDAVRLADGEKVPLRAVKQVQGGGHKGAMIGGMVATSLVLWPAAPLFLLMHGKDISIPKGTEITAYINGATPLTRAKFEPAIVPRGPAIGTSAQLAIGSEPSGADIEIDGAFVGQTPSTVVASAGDHRIVVRKAGFHRWERTLRVTTGTVSMNAVLESGVDTDVTTQTGPPGAAPKAATSPTTEPASASPPQPNPPPSGTVRGETIGSFAPQQQPDVAGAARQNKAEKKAKQDESHQNVPR